MTHHSIHLSLEVYADVASETATTWITTWSPIIVAVIGATFAGLWAAHNRRKGNVESRFPDVNEIWSQQARQSLELDHERTVRRRLEDYSQNLLRVFRGYHSRVSTGGSVQLTQQEEFYIKADPPTAGTPKTPQA